MQFQAPPQPIPGLGASDVHVWLANIDATEEEFHRYGSVLSTDEREKAARFRFERDQRRYTVARGILRTLLGHYVQKNPQDLAFNYNPHGKPNLSGDACQFNLAHSYGWAVFGFVRSFNIGVDIERIRPELAGDEIATRFFSKNEAAALRTVPDAARTKAFFDCWARKEAFIKAKGMGVFLGLHSFEVSLCPGEAPALLFDERDPDAPSRWTILELQPPEGYVGAVAVDGRDPKLQCWTWKTP